MTRKSVQQIIPAQKVNMGGHVLDQPLPISGLEYFDPFLLIHHWVDELPGEQHPRAVGVGPHPHRGFSPVTFIYEGDVHHRDSMGNNAIVGAGGTQWMFAGKGLTHSERPSAEMAAHGGKQEFIQFWVNAPSQNKLDPPFYKPISKEETPTISEDGVTTQVVCGTYNGVAGSVKYYSPLTLLRIEIQAGSKTTLDLPQGWNTLIYQLDGALTINESETRAKDMTTFKHDGERISLAASKTTRLIVLSGEPLNEPMKQYGPFVMNTQTEIMQALRDSQMGKMGVLIEEF